MRWSLVALGLAAIAALAASTGACGSQITVPDQGIIVTGCQKPAFCFRFDCTCSRGAALGSDMGPPSCVIPADCGDMGDPTMCNCPAGEPEMGTPLSQCLEPTQACVGRGVFCGGAGALCYPAGATSCSASMTGGVPPMLIPTVGMPMLEPHCQFTDDVCCPGTDGGIVSD